MIEQTEEYRAVKRERDEALDDLRKLQRDIARVHSDPPPRILVIDDDPAALTALAADLAEFSGMEVTSCSDPLEAQQLLDEHDYAGVVIDLHLGHHAINGVTLAEQVKRNRGRVLAIVSGDPEAADVAERLVAHWLEKPYRREDGDTWATQHEPRRSVSLARLASDIIATQRQSIV